MTVYQLAEEHLSIDQLQEIIQKKKNSNKKTKKGTITLSLEINEKKMLDIFYPFFNRAMVLNKHEKEENEDFYLVSEVAELEKANQGTITSMLRNKKMRQMYFPNSYKNGKRWEIAKKDYENYREAKKSVFFTRRV